MKPGVRALGLAFSDGASTSTCGGAVVRRDRVVDGLGLSRCAVGGTDATDAAVAVWEALDREDVRHVLVAGVAPAWFNLLDLDALREATERPVVAVSFEDGPGLSEAIDEAFDDEARTRRLDRYEALPPRRPVDAGATTLYVRAVGVDLDRAAAVVRAHTPEGQGRPEPLRVARLAARSGRAHADAVTGDSSFESNGP